jgi:enoyl-CoA hydratase/carnithine racemase
VLEEFAALSADVALVVDLGSDAPVREVASARRTLGQLPCPSIALITDEVSPAGAKLVGRFDLVARSETDLEQLLAAIERAPQASMMLVQLLRHGERLDVHEGLIAESLAYSVLQAGPEFADWKSGRKSRAPKTDPGPPVRSEREGARLLVEFNRPSKRNAFSREMRDGLVEALHVAVSDASLAEIVLRGAGPSFCSGGDLDEFGTLPDPASAHGIRSTRSPARLMAACGERLTVELHGACVGAGIELPAFAGRVIAAPDTFVQLPEVAFGLVPGAGGTVSIPRRIGRQRAAWLALTSARLPVEQALAWGLVDEIAG